MEKLLKTGFYGSEQNECAIYQLQIAEIDVSFFEIFTKMNVIKMVLRPYERMFCLDIFYLGLGCTYHHNLVEDIHFSQARVKGWVSSICQEVNLHMDLNLIPGKHILITVKNESQSF